MHKIIISALQTAGRTAAGRTAAGLATGLAAGVSLPALAQGVEAPYADSIASDAIIVTASRLSLEQRQIGSAVTVVTNQDLKQGQIIFVKDILQDVAGLQISTDRPGDLTTVSVRGSDSDQVLWLIDGIRLGDPSSITTQFQPDHLTSRDIERVEILRGNQSSLYGSDAIGGVINIITERATEDGIRFNAEGEGGSYGTVNGGASVLGKSGALDFRLTATGYSHDGPSLADPRTAPPAMPVTEDDGYWRYGFNGRVGVAATDTLSFQAVGLWQKSHTDRDGSDFLSGSQIDSADTSGVREYAGALQANYLSLDGRFRADASVSRYVARRLYFGATNLPDGDLYKGTLDSANLNLSYNDGSVISIAAGGSYIKEKSWQATLDWSALDPFGSPPVTMKNSIDTKSAYGEIAVRPIENLTITGAARIDDNSRFGSFDTYRGTVAYVVPGALGADSVKFRASYGTAAKSPSLYQLYEPYYGNVDLQPLKSRGGDFGVDMNFDRFSAQFTYFFTKIRDDFGWDNSLFRYIQLGRTRQQGVEIAFTLKPVEGISIQQSFTYLEAKSDDDEDGRYLDIGRPKHSGSTSVTLTPVDRLSLTARARYRSRNASSYGGVTEAYAVADLLASYGITEQIELYGRVTNLFDKFYQMSYGTNALGRAAYGGVRVSF
ncbi:MAG: TonB-dependent receptor plug domain-containing protein [Sphingobium sp.]